MKTIKQRRTGPGTTAIREKTKMKKLAAIAAVSLLGVVLAHPAQGTTTNIYDNFSDNEVFTPTYSANGTKWVIDSGSFSADGTAVNIYGLAGWLNFGDTVQSKIHIGFGAIPSNTPFAVQFDLLEWNGAHVGNYYFDLTVGDTSVGSYTINMSLLPTFGSGPSATGFQLSSPNVLGTAGADLTAWPGPDTIALSFDPAGGVVLKDNGTPVLSFANSLGLTRLNYLSLDSGNGSAVSMSWYVDNVLVTVPEPSSVMLAGLGGLIFWRRWMKK